MTQRTTLEHSRDRFLAHVGALDRDSVRAVADREATWALHLTPQPTDPTDHLRADYALTRAALQRLPEHDPARVVPVTLDGFTYAFTPRKVLRRVLDHAVDHLNQVEQWVAWHGTGLVPTPTDGWASSADHLDEDILPITPKDLSAWLWRIDLVMSQFIERVARLSPDELNWVPPDRGWTLHRVVHHVARSGRFYSAWLDAALPEDPTGRYVEASRRLIARLEDLESAPAGERVTFYEMTGRPFRADEAVSDSLRAEERLLAHL